MTKKSVIELSQVKEGEKVTCIDSKSNAYTKGQTYTVSRDNAGILVLTGNDGLTDPWSLLISKFKKVENETTKRKS